MRTFLVLAVLAGLTLLFVVQKQREPRKNETTGKTALDAAASPRPASAHNWMKQSLDRTAEVKRQVAQQRKEDGTR